MSLKVKVHGVDYQIEPQLKNLMEYFTQAAAIEKINANQVIQINTVPQNIWDDILHICRAVKCEFPEVPKVKTNDLADVFSNKQLAEILGKKSYGQINELYRAAQFLKIQKLRKCIAATMAALVYVKPNLNDYRKRKEFLGIKVQLDDKLAKQMKERYPFMN